MAETSHKILLVEDDAFMVELLTHEFSNAGFEISVARTGAEGVEKFKESAPDIILLDVLLPDQNGFDTLRKIRREPGGPEMKAMFLSNLSEETDIEEAKRLGAIDYLVKANFALPEIVERVKKAAGTA
ncbi:MAG: response regulator [Candidatus Sungbacteria bacterium]|nr:response regulator [Candidatus Sungbacteria bacterium]